MMSCSDEDSFSISRSDRLSFSRDTVLLDTVFSTVPTSTYTFWVYNNSSDGLRVRQVRLQRGNQTGFRVNVDGTYLDNTTGSLVNNVEIRKGDSIRVFVELTSARTNVDEPQLVEDNLVFFLESGVEQKVNLRAYSWDALIYDDMVIKKDTTISSSKPIIIRRGIKVDSMATLTVNAPTRLYFHSGAGLDVYGRLLVNENAAVPGEVVMRGDRTDRMFDYLPYDRVSGQWKGIRIHSSSKGNRIVSADIHSSEYGIVCDSAAYDAETERLRLESVTIHNCKGTGLELNNANAWLANCQITNTLGDCVQIYGGKVLMVYCTLGQFYPFSADRGVALRFSNMKNEQHCPLQLLECYNSLITGDAEDEIMGEAGKDTLVAFQYYFQNCILKTPAVDEEDKEVKSFVDVLFETSEDTINGRKHFLVIDDGKQYYDFHLDSLSTARKRAVPVSQYPYDRGGAVRGDTPDAGCYQFEAKPDAATYYLR